MLPFWNWSFTLSYMFAICLTTIMCKSDLKTSGVNSLGLYTLQIWDLNPQNYINYVLVLVYCNMLFNHNDILLTQPRSQATGQIIVLENLRFITFICLTQKKKSALFEMAEVIPVMTNNYEDSILKGVQVFRW